MFFLGLILLATALLPLSLAAEDARPPNVIFVLTDDLGYSDIGCYGAKKVATPHIDRLAAEGLKFTEFRTGASICSPSRAAFLTGAYPQRTGLYMGINPKRTAHWFLGLHPDEITLAEQFKARGYATGMVGKWHLGTEPEFSMLGQGFDDYYGLPCNFDHDPRFFDGEEVIFARTPLARLTELYTARVTDFIRRNSRGDQPFFLYYAHNYPHTPYQAGPQFEGSSQDGLRGDIMQELDWGIGEMMQALEDTGVAENTLVIFTSDNGPTANQYAGPFRGTKYVTFEGGHRVPFILHWPGGITEPATIDTPVHAMDLFPTLSDLIGAPLPDDRVYDGLSLLPLIEGHSLTRSTDEPFFYYNCENLQAVRRGDWKLHLAREREQVPFWDKNKAFFGIEGPVLYHLKEDVAETTDVADQHPEIVAELQDLAKDARQELGEFMQRGSGQRPTGTAIPDAPIISHEKDWHTVDPAIAATIAAEREARHPALKAPKPKPKGKSRGKQTTAQAPTANHAEPRPPNVVLIFADDLGYGDLGCYGATKLETPHIDRLAAEGRKFTDAHSASAVCTPSRYALITGEYPVRRGLSKPVFLKTGLVIDTDRTTVADVMKGAGYATACIGKWHLGFGEQAPDWNGDLKPGPLELGFDHYYGVPVVNSHPPFVYVENHRVVGLVPDDPFVFGRKANTQEIFEKLGYDLIGGADAAHALYDDYAVGTHLAEKSVEWIEANKDQPFFLYLATTNIHHPFTPAPRFRGTSECGVYGDFVHELDWMVGEVMTTLENHDLAENTLVIFTSDNGGMFNIGGQQAWDAGHELNGELLGFKFGAWEGGHRVPFIARWPGKIDAGSVSDQLISNVDLLATMAALTGQDVAAGQARDSVDVLPALTGDPDEPLRDHLILSASQSTHIAIRQGKWIYIPARGSGGFTAAKRGGQPFGGPGAITYTGRENSDIENGRIKRDAPPAQLYNLESDLAQTTNVHDQHPEIVAELKALLETYRPPKPSPRQKGGARARR